MGGLSRLKRWIAVQKRKKKAQERAASRRGTEDAHEMATYTTKATGPPTELGDRKEDPVDNVAKDRASVDRKYKENLRALQFVHISIEIVAILNEAAEASSILSPLKATCVAITKVLELASANLFDEIQSMSLVDILQAHYRLIDDERCDIRARESRGLIYPPLPSLVEALRAYLEALNTIHVRIKERYQVHREMVSLGESTQGSGDARELEDQLERTFGFFMRQVHDCILHATISMGDQVDNKRLTQLLNGAIEARGHRVKPLAPGTRLKLIDRISTWARSLDKGEQIFWLHDIAGTGKSALAAHMAQRWHTEGVLAARFFFNQNGGRNFRTLDRLFLTLAQEISENYPSAKQLVLNALEGPQNTDRPFQEAFHHLITSVVEHVSRMLGKPLVFVIDALDECAEDDVQLLITALLSGPFNSERVRFLLTSRPTKEIKAILDGVANVGGKNVVLLDVKSEDAVRDHDITIYVRQTLANFPTEDQDTVIECARGVFLWATLACDTLQRTVAPTKTLQKFKSNSPHGQMTNLYEAVLETVLPPNPSSRDFKLLKSVLQGVTLTCTPVSIFSIQSFFPNQKNDKIEEQDYVEFFVKNLGTIMKDGTPYLPIYLLHPTFREFIEDQKRGAKFYISPPAGHCSIAVACLDLLSGLTADLLGLAHSNSPLPHHTQSIMEPPEKLLLDTEAPFRYAVAFWATHVALALGEDETVRARIVPFLESSLLKWLEWSSVLKTLHESFEGLTLLRQSVQIQLALGASKMSTTAAQWCVDSLRFLQRNSHTIDACGLQTWMSALAFTPKRSIVYQTFHHASIRPLPEVITHQPDNFDNHRILDDQGNDVSIAAVSSDGRRILTHPGLGTLQLWNLKNFKSINVLRHQVDTRMEAQFSSDGSLIVTGGGEEAEIYFWNGLSGTGGECLLPRRHNKRLIGLVFALSDRVVISIAQDGETVCWSVTHTEGRKPRGRVMQGDKHTGRMTKIVASPSGKLVATFSIDHSIRLWSTERAERVGNPMVGDDEALSGSFSIDGMRIVAGYANGEVIIWNVEFQTVIHRLERDEKRVSNVTVSPDGRMFASGVSRLCLWDIDTGKLVCPLTGHTHSVKRLAFDRKGNRLVSGSWDCSIRVWDIRRHGLETSVENFALKGHTQYINGIALSPDGRVVTSSSKDGTVRVWDTNLRDAYDNNEPFEFTHKKVSHLAFSDDGTRLVSAGEDGSFQVWDATAGEKLGNLLQSEDGSAGKPLFSTKNQLWASGHSTGNVCLWYHNDANENHDPYVLICQLGAIECMAFTPDASYIAIGGQDHNVQLWDVVNRVCKSRFDCSSNLIQLAISRDGKHMASYSTDRNIRFWDLHAHTMVHGPTLIGARYRSSITSMTHMVFSSDGKTLATSDASFMQLFDVESDITCFVSLIKSNISMSALIYPTPSFSMDGKYVFFGNHILNLSTMPRDRHTERFPWPSEKLDILEFSPISPLYASAESGFIYSLRWSAPLLSVPGGVQIEEWAAHANTLAFGTSDGRVFILRFPKDYI